MGKFKESEKERYSEYKKSSQYFSQAAKKDGLYNSILRPFCLPKDNSLENLFPEIRESALRFFTDHEIKWHDAIDKKPSNHLCDSMVCGVNFLYPFYNQPEALKSLLSPLFPSINKMLPIEKNHFVSFEWIGMENYLGERIPRHGKRTRGANFTSADAVVMFERADGKKQIVLIEWKYTETYSQSFIRFAKSGTDRGIIYEHLYNRDDFPLKKDLIPNYDVFFYEPFYQLFRQQLLAHEMELINERGADIVSLLHISPKQNKQFERITSPLLEPLGDNVTDVWKKLVKAPKKFQAVKIEDVFSQFPIIKHEELLGWWNYIQSRYPWVLDLKN